MECPPHAHGTRAARLTAYPQCPEPEKCLESLGLQGEALPSLPSSSRVRFRSACTHPHCHQGASLTYKTRTPVPFSLGEGFLLPTHNPLLSRDLELHNLLFCCPVQEEPLQIREGTSLIRRPCPALDASAGCLPRLSHCPLLSQHRVC